MGKGTLLNKPCECGSGKKYKKCCLIETKQVLTGTDAESVVEFLTTKTFLRPWVFKSPSYTSDNKEFTDVAIYFRDTLILFEVTGSKFDKDNPQRYVKKIKKKHGQLTSAERIVLNKSKEVHFKNDLFDFKSNFEDIKYMHKIFLSTGDGEMAIANNYDENLAKKVTSEDLGRYCGFYNYENDIHSFTLSELEYASKHINTLKDFKWYLDFEQKFLKNDFGDTDKTIIPVVDTQREDLIATYILTYSWDEELNRDGNLNLYKIFGENDLSESDMIMYSATDVHKGLEDNETYKEIISERKNSYFWDDLINEVASKCQTLLRIEGGAENRVPSNINDMRDILEVLSHTSRFERVHYSNGILDSVKRQGEQKIAYKNAFSISSGSNVMFSYLRFKHKETPDDSTQANVCMRHAYSAWCRVNFSETFSTVKDQIEKVLLITHHYTKNGFSFSFGLSDPIQVELEECKKGGIIG